MSKKQSPTEELSATILGSAQKLSEVVDWYERISSYIVVVFICAALTIIFGVFIYYNWWIVMQASFFVALFIAIEAWGNKRR